MSVFIARKYISLHRWDNEKWGIEGMIFCKWTPICLSLKGGGGGGGGWRHNSTWTVCMFIWLVLLGMRRLIVLTKYAIFSWMPFKLPWAVPFLNCRAYTDFFPKAIIQVASFLQPSLHNLLQICRLHTRVDWCNNKLKGNLSKYVQASTLTQDDTGPVGPVTPSIYWSCKRFTGPTFFL